MAFTRVRKADAQAQSKAQAAHWIQPDGLDICLACWQDYMRCDDRDLGISRVHLQGSVEEDAHATCESDPYAEQRKADLKIGEATDAMIDSLPRLYIWAIYKAYGIGQAWNFPHADLMVTLEEAKRELEGKLRWNALTRAKF